MKDSKKHPIITLNILEQFLTTLYGHLQKSRTPETAFINTVVQEKSRLPNSFLMVAKQIQISGIPLQIGLSTLQTKHKGAEMEHVLSALQRILQHSIQDSLPQIHRFIIQVRRQRTLLKQREGIQHTIQFKTRILLCLTSFLIGFIFSMAPLMGIMQQISSLDLNNSTFQIFISPPPIYGLLVSMGLVGVVHARISYRVGFRYAMIQVGISLLLVVVGSQLSQFLFMYPLVGNIVP